MTKNRSWICSWSKSVSSRVIGVGLAMVVAWSLASPCTAQVITLTVGPNGSYSTIQGALASVVNGWENDVRIQSGTYPENVVIEPFPVPLSNGELHLSGGWDPNFTAQSVDSSLTVIDGSSSGSCLRVAPTPTDVTKVFVSNLTLTNGAAERGGGVYFETTGDVWLELSNTILSNNVAIAPTNPTAGGGLYAVISGMRNRLAISDSSFRANAALPDAGAVQARGGGAFVDITGASPADFRRVTFTDNVVNGVVQEDGGGLYLLIGSGSVAFVNDCEFVGNQAVAASGGLDVVGTGLFAYGSDGAYLRMRRLTLLDNISATGTGDQMFYWGIGTSTFRAGDILAAGGHRGVTIYGDDTAEILVTNVTATDNTATGFYVWNFSSTAVMGLDNTLLYGNGVDLDITGIVAVSNNLVGINPLFVNPAAGNYRLGAGSQAANAGTNSPAAGLGDADCSGGLRVIDGTVDIGAYEGVDLLFSAGFESHGTRRWSDTVGASG